MRIAMTIVDVEERDGVIGQVIEDESNGSDGASGCVVHFETGRINADLTVGARTHDVRVLEANEKLSSQGVTPLGTGFRLDPSELKSHGIDERQLPPVVRPYLIGRDLVQAHQPKFIIDFFGLSQAESQTKYPSLYQRVLNHVKPERDQKKRDSYRHKWWIFAEPRSSLRAALNGLRRYIATCRTAKHRLFEFVGGESLPDAKIVAIGLDDGFFLGCLSSRHHVSWAMATGGWLGVGNDSNYNHSDCLGKFPFPNATPAVVARIRLLADQLDTHRKRQQELHPKLTMTGMYNVLEKLRSGDALDAKEKTIHEQGLVSVLKQIHDELDAAVAEAYGWPVDLSDEEILERLVALNHERAEEEKRGIIRWLRPEFQNPAGKTQRVVEDDDTERGKGEGGRGKATGKPTGKKAAKGAAKVKKAPWPKELAEQAAAVLGALAAIGEPADVEAVAARFTRANRERVEELLETFAAIGKARELADGRWVAM